MRGGRVPRLMVWTAYVLVIVLFAAGVFALVLGAIRGDRSVLVAACAILGSLLALFAWVWRSTLSGS